MNFASDIDVAYTPDALVAAADWEKLAKFNEAVLAERVLIGGGSRFVVSAALCESDIDDALDRIDAAMGAIE